MHVADCYLTLAITAKGEPKLLYLGANPGEAEAARLKAGADIAEVGVCAHPMVLMPRFPILEAAEQKARKESAQIAEDRRAKVLALEADKAEAAAKELLAKAKSIRKSLS